MADHQFPSEYSHTGTSFLTYLLPTQPDLTTNVANKNTALPSHITTHMEGDQKAFFCGVKSLRNREINGLRWRGCGVIVHSVYVS
ncbi:MAG: hypothetical protein Kow00105_07300 [Phycisphaeraceae bacterium]